MPSCSPQLAADPSLFPFTAPSPIPILSHGLPSLSSLSYTAPITPADHPYVQPQVIPHPEDLGFGFPTAAESFPLPAVHPSPVYNPSHEEYPVWCQYPQSDPFHLGTHPFNPITGATPPEVALPAPVASSSGPQRARQPVREGRRYDPVRPTKKADPKKGDWDRTLVRFRAELDNTLYSVHNGQPSGGLVPAMALARIDQLVKEDLKRSPLRGTKAGEGKRSRNVEKYLEGLLEAIRRVAPTPIPVGGGSDESDTAVAALSRLADELEAKLAVVNQQPAFRQSTSAPESRKKTDSEKAEQQLKKNGSEKVRRDNERYHMKRISRLFKASKKPWSKKDALGLAVIFLLYGPAAFPAGFVKVCL